MTRTNDRAYREMIATRQMTRFARIWQAMAALGLCDTFGGMEWARVSKLWEEAGKPEAMATFIEANANKPAQI